MGSLVMSTRYFTFSAVKNLTSKPGGVHSSLYSIGIRHHECLCLPTLTPSLNLVFIQSFIHPKQNLLIQIMHSCTSWKLLFLDAPRVHMYTLHSMYRGMMVRFSVSLYLCEKNLHIY
ncbi:hypothetical protein EYC84_002428 [Monilinia fructicola]|uniref:Uncharacterized protein n=1 Tax=Monilinia fructicola TaxID=38448 RepID=A0A5M9JT69_MONFR|nr:hypothetical protein EYC84_002428 [Monilinia fructicola]